MAENGQEKIIAFDTLFTTNQIQILKILLSYMEPAHQKHMAVYIKFLELQYTLSFFREYPASSPAVPPEETMDATKLCDEILPFCNPSEQEMLQNMRNMYQNFQNMQEMMQMVQMMKDMFPEGDNSAGQDPMAMFSGLSGMFGSDGPDMSQLFEMLQNK